MFSNLYFKALTLSTKLSNANDGIGDIIGEPEADAIENLVRKALTVVQWAGWILCAVLFAVVGIKWMISNQNGEETQKIKQGIKGLVIGAIILGLAGTIAAVIENFIKP